jgi:hypothetical protein
MKGAHSGAHFEGVHHGRILIINLPVKWERGSSKLLVGSNLFVPIALIMVEARMQSRYRQVGFKGG